MCFYIQTARIGLRPKEERSSSVRSGLSVATRIDVSDIVGRMFEINSRHISKRLAGTVLFVGLVVVCSSTINVGQTPPPEIPDFAPTVSFSDCLDGLKDESIKSMFDRNRELIKAVDEHGVGFQLSTNTRDVLTKAGAGDGLPWWLGRPGEERLQVAVVSRFPLMLLEE